eukprot:c5867_g1_i2.p1 GENE.c5867_g1_i2~~c5867_g1_i2.p1  ORF type:complete len:303 (+),score=76.41 c5867_g1_i2:30-938(+)
MRQRATTHELAERLAGLSDLDQKAIWFSELTSRAFENKELAQEMASCDLLILVACSNLDKQFPIPVRKWALGMLVNISIFAPMPHPTPLSTHVPMALAKHVFETARPSSVNQTEDVGWGLMAIDSIANDTLGKQKLLQSSNLVNCVRTIAIEMTVSLWNGFAISCVAKLLGPEYLLPTPQAGVEGEGNGDSSAGNFRRIDLDREYSGTWKLSEIEIAREAIELLFAAIHNQSLPNRDGLSARVHPQICTTCMALTKLASHPTIRAEMLKLDALIWIQRAIEHSEQTPATSQLLELLWGLTIQ